MTGATKIVLAFTTGAAAAALVVAASVMPATNSDEYAMEFDVPAGYMADTVHEWSRQCFCKVLYDWMFDGPHTSAVRGFYKPSIALDLMLRDTGLHSIKYVDERSIGTDPTRHAWSMVYSIQGARIECKPAPGQDLPSLPCSD